MNTETKETTNSFWGFLGRVVVAQFVTYFFMGVLAVGTCPPAGRLAPPAVALCALRL